MKYWWKSVYIAYWRSNGYLECDRTKHGNGIGNGVRAGRGGVTGVTEFTTGNIFEEYALYMEESEWIQMFSGNVWVVGNMHALGYK